MKADARRECCGSPLEHVHSEQFGCWPLLLNISFQSSLNSNEDSPKSGMGLEGVEQEYRLQHKMLTEINLH